MVSAVRFRLVPPSGEEVMALSDIKVRSIKPADKPIKVTDGQGMFLLVKPTGAKYWRLQYRFGGKQKVLALGVYPIVSLAEARRKRDEAKKLVSDGIDPSEKKKETRIEQSGAFTFEAVARSWHATNRKWSEDHSRRVLKSLEDNLFPAIGKRNITELKTRDVLVPIKAVEKSGRLEVASRLQQRTTAIMRYAVQSGIIDYNPAQEMSGAVATGKRQHRPALELKRIPELLNRIENYKTGRKLTRLAVELTLLIFIRSSELRFARWSEINFETALWTIPAERTPIEKVKNSHRGSKMRTPHLVPLSRQALDILEQIKEISGDYDLIFIGDHNPRKPMSENTVNKALRGMGYDTKVEVCGHGFRSIACSSLVESGKWTEDAIERQMSHIERNSVRAAYIHLAEHLDERKLMLQWWADYLDANKERHITPFEFTKA